MFANFDKYVIVLLPQVKEILDEWNLIPRVSGIRFRCLSKCRMKLAASFLSSFMSPGMVLKRAGPEEQNELNFRVSNCVAPVVFKRLH